MSNAADVAGLIRTGVFDVIRHECPLPDPKDERYVKHTAQVIGMEELNGWPRPVRRVTISGVHLVFDAADRRGVLKEYNEQEDIKELYIVADAVVVARPLRFPQTNVTIICRSLRFEGASALIDTTPKTTDYRELLSRDGRNGPAAGNITLCVASLGADPLAAARLMARGGAGQAADEGEVLPSTTRKDVRVVTKADWDANFTYANRRLIHEEVWEKGPTLYNTDPFEDCDWQQISRQCANAITYVELVNSCWVDAGHSHTRQYTVFTIGSKTEPGTGGAGSPPGKPGTGGGGGKLTTTVALGSVARDLSGGTSAPKHPGTPGGAGGTPTTACWVLFSGRPLGRGPDGAKHIVTYEIVRKTASTGPGSGPGPAPDQPKGADGMVVDYSALPDARDLCGAAWVAPLLLNLALQYARDVANAELPDEARTFLKPYVDALAGRDPATVTGWQRSLQLAEDVAGGGPAMQQLRDELLALDERLSHRLDCFGNPPGWVPNLGLASMVGAYDTVRDISLKELFNAYYLEKTWQDKERRADALKQLIAVLVEQSGRLRDQIIDTRNAIMQRGYTPPTDVKSARPVSIEDLTRGPATAGLSFSDMSLLERMNSLVQQMDDLETKRAGIEARLRQEADKKSVEREQWEAVQAGLKISGAVLKALPLPPPYEMVASAAGGLLEVTSSFLEQGGDDAAYASLKTEMAGFTKANQDGLVKQFTEGMDAELSQYSKEITALEDSAKATKTAADDANQKYQAGLASAKKARDAEAAALSDRSKQRLRQRQPAPDPASAGPIGFNEEIAKRALAMKGDPAAKTAAEAAHATRVTDLKKEKDATDARTKELKAKVDATTKAKAERAQSTKDNLERARKMVDGIEQIGKTINKMRVSETQLNSKWNEALAKIQTKDPEFQGWLSQVAFLNEQKKVVVGRLVQLLGDLGEQRQQLARKLTTINELRTQYAKSGVDGLDHGTLLYIQSMRDDAHRRLTRFLYLVSKAYEYYTVSPWPQFYADARKVFEDLRTVLDKPSLDLQANFDQADSGKAEQLRKLITAPSGPDLSSLDQALLKGVYEKPLRDMGTRMIELMTNSVGRIDEIKQPVVLRGEELAELNRRLVDGRTGRTVLNLARLDVVSSTNEKQRVAGFKVVKAVGRKLGAQFPDGATFKVTHLGKSIVRAHGRFFAFDSQAGAEADGREAAPGVTFETNAALGKVVLSGETDLITLEGAALTQPDRRTQENLVSKLFGGATGITLSEFRPGIFSDFQLIVEFTPRSSRMEFTEIAFELELEKGNTDTDGALVTVFNAQGLSIPIALDRPDRGGRSLGLGAYFGVFKDSELDTSPVVITVPATYGSYRHVGWSGEKPVAGVHTRAVGGGMRVIATYDRSSQQ